MIAPDKKLHIAVGAAIAAATGFIFAPWIGLVLGIAAGASKEIYDNMTGKGTPEMLDFIATVIGAAAGAGFAYLVLTYGVVTQ